jgi:TonB family protein
MSILSKEAIETGSTKDSMVSPSVSPAPSPAAPAAGQIHSDAVSLEVALKVHGSKVSGGTRGVPGQTEPFEEEASSMIVFPHGGVLRLATPVNVGQMLVVTNLKTRQDAICRVIKVRNYSNSASYVEVEFTSKQPGYWGVYFESEAPESATTASAPGSNLSSSVLESKMPSSGQSATDDSTFVSFGAQEEVQPSASATAGPSASSRKSPTMATEPAPAKKAPDTVASPNASTATLDMDSEPESRTARAAGEALGSRLGGSATEEQSAGDKNWLVMGAGGAVLLAAIVGGALFFNRTPAAAPTRSTPSVSQQTPVSEPQQVSAPSPSPTVTPSSANARTNVTPSVATQPTPSTKTPRQMAVVRESPAMSEPVSQPEPAAAPAPTPAPAASNSGSRSSMPSVFGTLNAHPVAPSRSVTAAAPNVQASAPAMPDTSMLGITSPSNTAALPAPVINGSIPLPVGGRVKQPVMAKTVAPQYPPLAKQAHTQGDVTVQITIDKAGNVTEGKAISGPPVLRQAAVDAVRNWKFEPSFLDGQGISVQTLVTVRFQL